MDDDGDVEAIENWYSVLKYAFFALAALQVRKLRDGRGERERELVGTHGTGKRGTGMRVRGV